ncbi:hypothetical protein F6R98_05390 [Candidatus Methylospira mobilis]|uniref:Uncharacterized protein n=1 Tax=Candidatus Methylospira mobilis TaxID=1808979 RepID=A0A5Q0BG77_9GAMM|nr:Wadjet anti-phage system protein JetA family protein [Candidatus Methylospira mobilis]QFY42132.1 hypothetical protein F6R98_05390 [Candidatus Methylospira mobilis]
MVDLFQRIPDTLFLPLSGPNRHVYGRLLVDLYPLFFEQMHADVFPSAQVVRAELDELLMRMAVVDLALEDEFDANAEGAQTEAGLAQRVYRRLRNSGWLEEEIDGYRVRVSVRPAVATLWASLMEVARPEKVFYGGMVLSILNNVQRAVEDPQSQALAFRQAVTEARRFSQHLNAMIYGLKGLLGALAEISDHRQILGHFFDDFVERFLVADYKKLKTRNNPFRFRYDILARVRELEHDLERKQQLVAAYQEQTGLSDSEEAWQTLDQDIAVLRSVFEQVDDHLALVDLYRGRVEQKVADTVRYLDRSQPGMAQRLAGALQQLAPRVGCLEDNDEGLQWLPLLDAAPLSIYGLRAPSAPRKPPEPHLLSRQAIDPAVLEKQRAMRAYMDRRRIDPRRIEIYLDTHMKDAERLSSEQLPIADVEDFIAFTHLRHLNYLPGAERLRRRYRVERLDETMENAYLRCPRFVVHRTALEQNTDAT